MSGSKGGKKEQKTTIDPRLTNALLNNNSQSQQVANNLGVRQFADFNNDQLAAFDAIRNSAGAGADTMTAGIDATMGAANFDPSMVDGGSLLDMDIGAYMNPYTSQVIDTSMADIDRMSQMQQGQNAASAARAGAFGGSRHGVVEAETNRGALDTFARTAAGLRSSGFDAATGMAQGDLMRRLQAQMANQGAGLNAAQMRLAAGGQLGQMGLAQQQMGFAGANALGNVGSMQQGLAQQRLDAQRNLGMEQQNIRNASMGILSPLAGNSTTTQSQNGGWGQALGQAIGLGTMFLSDERAKENIEPMDGEDALGKLSFLSGNTYNYKDGLGQAPGRTGGVMAGDVRKVMPSAVGPYPGGGGLDGVDYPQITGLLVEAVKQLDQRTQGARA